MVRIQSGFRIEEVADSDNMASLVAGTRFRTCYLQHDHLGVPHTISIGQTSCSVFYRIKGQQGGLLYHCLD